MCGKTHILPGSGVSRCLSGAPEVVPNPKATHTTSSLGVDMRFLFAFARLASAMVNCTAPLSQAVLIMRLVEHVYFPPQGGSPS